MQALGFMQSPGLSHSGSGSQVLHKGADLVGPAFCALPGPSSSGDQVLGERNHPLIGGCILSPPLSQLLNFLGVQWVCLLFWGADFWL